MRWTILAACLAVASAHMCLVTPEQRGGLTEKDLNTQLTKPCGLLTFPCGGVPENPNRRIVTAGESFDVIFQKNYNHYNKDHPGHITVTLYSPHRPPQLLRTIADTDTPTFHLYTEHITLSDQEAGDGYVQVAYKQDGNSNQYIWYACADLHVKAKSAPPVG